MDLTRIVIDTRDLIRASRHLTEGLDLPDRTCATDVLITDASLDHLGSPLVLKRSPAERADQR